MDKFSLDEKMKIEIKATFIVKGSDLPVCGDGYLLRLFDKDYFGEDFLGESRLNEAGEGCIKLSAESFRDSLNKEILPDFYFVLYHDQIPVFQSKVLEDLNPKVIEQFEPGEGEVIDLGTYLVEDHQL
jgi:hypothetical protein